MNEICAKNEPNTGISRHLVIAFEASTKRSAFGRLIIHRTARQFVASPPRQRVRRGRARTDRPPSTANRSAQSALARPSDRVTGPSAIRMEVRLQAPGRKSCLSATFRRPAFRRFAPSIRGRLQACPCMARVLAGLRNSLAGPLGRQAAAVIGDPHRGDRRRAPPRYRSGAASRWNAPPPTRCAAD